MSVPRGIFHRTFSRLGLVAALAALGVVLTGGTASAGVTADFVQVSYPGGYFKAGDSFNISAKAISFNSGSAKVDKSVNGPAQITDSSGTIGVDSGGTFTAGVMNASVHVPGAQHHDRITVTINGSSGQTGNINAEGPLDHIAVAYPGSPQFTGEPFNLPLTAFDSAGNVITSYDQSVTLSDLSGTVKSAETGTTTVPNHWVNGQETIPVTVGSTFVHDRVTVTGASGGSGTSGSFNVLFSGST
jgi:hypothetical protein